MPEAKSADLQMMSVASRHMSGYVRAALAGAVVLVVVSTLFVIGAPAANAVGAEGESWPSFNESDGCGSPWMRGPNAQASGWLPASTVLRGPHADYFGRTVDQVWDSLVWWDVPMSNGESLRLHERMMPALDQVEANLAQAASDGYLYRIIDRYTFGYAARTVGGSYRLSQHGLGNAIDINSKMNPYTTKSLRTDMPEWFRTAWQDAGYCWGGDWVSVKDAMHYNWRGPLFTPGMTELPPAYPPRTSAEGFTRTMHTDSVPPRIESTSFRLLMDGDNDGAIDVVNVNTSNSGGVIDVLRARNGYQGCVVSRYPTDQLAEATVAINGDWDRDGAQDLWLINDTSGVDITAYLRFGDFTETATAELDVSAGDAYLAADHDVDGWSDLYILRYDGDAWQVEVRSGADRFATVIGSGAYAGAPDTRFSALDRNRDQVPDLVAVGAASSTILDGSTGFGVLETLPGIAGDFDDVAGSDYDGDGRHDIVTLEGTSLEVLAGNSRQSGQIVTSWFEYPEYSCSGGSPAYPFTGTFRDDDESVHRFDIDEIAEIGVTRGCNPPLNDLFCPDREITRGELAAFLRRALDAPYVDADTFRDDDESEFEGDIEALAAIGVTAGCNPPASDRFCPDRKVTRGEMAVFMARAFDVPIAATDYFTDDDASPFESEINAIAQVGVTKGCNPPANTRFCPDRLLPREEMASFMVRALALFGP